nr:MAG: hypothetical protein [Drosophila Burdiehouse burn chuvirus]
MKKGNFVIDKTFLKPLSSKQTRKNVKSNKSLSSVEPDVQCVLPSAPPEYVLSGFYQDKSLDDKTVDCLDLETLNFCSMADEIKQIHIPEDVANKVYPDIPPPQDEAEQISKVFSTLRKEVSGLSQEDKIKRTEQITKKTSSRGAASTSKVENKKKKDIDQLQICDRLDTIEKDIRSLSIKVDTLNEKVNVLISSKVVSDIENINVLLQKLVHSNSNMVHDDNIPPIDFTESHSHTHTEIEPKSSKKVCILKIPKKFL